MSTGDIPDKMGNVDGAVETYGVQRKDEAIWVLFVALLVLVGIFVAGFLCKSKSVERVAMTVSVLLVTVLVVLCTLVMIALVRGDVMMCS